MFKEKQIKPLNFFGARRLKNLPPHFEIISQPMVYNLELSISKWINFNLKGRFYVGRGVEVQNGSIEQILKIGFEDPKEASYFMLACPHLKYN